MPLAAFYDIHGNLPALEAAVAEAHAAGVDQIVVGGDVLPGPMGREALEFLLGQNIPVHFIRGNGETAVLTLRSGRVPHVPQQALPSIRWSAEQLDDRLAQLIVPWPATLRVELPEIGPVLFCHATPRNDYEIFTKETAEACLLPVFDGVGAPIVVCGHTHMPFDRRVGQTRVINAGSVGMPFGEPGADWLLLGPDVQLRHTRYDLTQAAERIRGTAYPDAQDFAEHSILHPPRERDMLAAFARVAIS